MARNRKRRPGSPSGKGSSSGARQLAKPARTTAGLPAFKPVKLRDLSASQLQDYENSQAVLAAGRRGYAFGFDTQGRFSRIPVRGVRQAARIIGIPFRKVERYAGSQLFRDRKGRIQVTPADRLPRRMLIPTALGDLPIVVRGSRKASLLSKYRRAILTGDESELQKFKDKKVAGHELITDIRTIQALLDAGAIDPAEMYAGIQGGGIS
jgi:hypothetical protein